MNTGDVIVVTFWGTPVEVVVVDDNFRVLPGRQTLLVKLVESPYTEFEINQKELYRGKDLQGSERLGA
jgi:hypothetical protein